MVKQGFQNGLVFLTLFSVVSASAAPFCYSRPPAKETTKSKHVETADKEDASKDKIEPIVPATEITMPVKPILVKPMQPHRRIGNTTKPIIPPTLKFEKPSMLSEPTRVTTLTKSDLAKIEAISSAQNTVTATGNKPGAQPSKKNKS